MPTDRETVLWLALFGGVDSGVAVSFLAHSGGMEADASSSPFLYVVAILVCLVCCGLMCGGDNNKVATQLGDSITTAAGGLTDRLGSIVRSHRENEAAGLMGESANFGDPLDRAAEDRYLQQRGSSLGDGL